MCRKHQDLVHFEPPATELEIRDASLSFVRKLSGFTLPRRPTRAASTAPSTTWRRQRER